MVNILTTLVFVTFTLRYKAHKIPIWERRKTEKKGGYKMLLRQSEVQGPLEHVGGDVRAILQLML